MPYIIPGYDYDICFRYCDKDNKYHRCVTDFADNPGKDLELTSAPLNMASLNT